MDASVLWEDKEKKEKKRRKKQGTEKTLTEYSLYSSAIALKSIHETTNSSAKNHAAMSFSPILQA